MWINVLWEECGVRRGARPREEKQNVRHSFCSGRCFRSHNSLLTFALRDFGASWMDINCKQEFMLSFDDTCFAETGFIPWLIHKWYLEYRFGYTLYFLRFAKRGLFSFKLYLMFFSVSKANEHIIFLRHGYWQNWKSQQTPLLTEVASWPKYKLTSTLTMLTWYWATRYCW